MKPLDERQLKRVIIDLSEEMPIKVLGVKETVYIQDLNGRTLRKLSGFIQPGFKTLDIHMLLDCVAGNTREYLNNLNEILDSLIGVKQELKGKEL